METMYLVIVAFLLCLAIFDLFVGVSNDAVNFLNSAIGAKVAKFRTVLIVASAGVAIGAVMSSGMMDVARHGIMQPSNFSFYDVMTIFLAVMVTDVIILDIFNNHLNPYGVVCLGVLVFGNSLAQGFDFILVFRNGELNLQRFLLVSGVHKVFVQLLNLLFDRTNIFVRIVNYATIITALQRTVRLATLIETINDSDFKR